MAKKKRRPPAGSLTDPDNDWDLDEEAALKQCEEILTSIEDASEEIQEQALDFFTSVKESVEQVQETIEKTSRVTRGQQNAINNWEQGVARWLERER